MDVVLGIAVFMVGVAFIFMRGFQYSLISQDKQNEQYKLSDTQSEMKSINRSLVEVHARMNEMESELKRHQGQLNSLSLKAGFKI